MRLLSESQSLMVGIVRSDGRTNTGPEVDAVRAALDLGVVKVPPEVEGPRAEG